LALIASFLAKLTGADGITFGKDRIDRHRSWAHTASIKGIFQAKFIYEELRERYPRPPARKSAKAAVGVEKVTAISR
jgi:hypothetical protein